MHEGSDVMNLKNRRIAVTGAARGIGRGIAAACASRGAAVALFDINASELKGLASEISTGGGRVSAHAADVRDCGAMKSAAERAETALGGPLDGLVLNAGIAAPAELDSLTPELWDTMMDVNLNGCFYSYKACEESLLRSAAPRRAIVIVSSGSAFTGSGAGVHYAASKAGQIGMMLGLARALGPRGIGVNAIAPRTIRTPFSKVSTPPGMHSRLWPPRFPWAGWAPRRMRRAPRCFCFRKTHRLSTDKPLSSTEDAVLGESRHHPDVSPSTPIKEKSE